MAPTPDAAPPPVSNFSAADLRHWNQQNCWVIIKSTGVPSPPINKTSIPNLDQQLSVKYNLDKWAWSLVWERIRLNGWHSPSRTQPRNLLYFNLKIIIITQMGCFCYNNVGYKLWDFFFFQVPSCLLSRPGYVPFRADNLDRISHEWNNNDPQIK